MSVCRNSNCYYIYCIHLIEEMQGRLILSMYASIGGFPLSHMSAMLQFYRITILRPKIIFSCVTYFVYTKPSPSLYTKGVIRLRYKYPNFHTWTEALKCERNRNASNNIYYSCYRKLLFGKYVNQVWRRIHMEFGNASKVSHPDGDSDVSGLRLIDVGKKKKHVGSFVNEEDDEENEDGNEESNDGSDDEELGHELQDDGLRDEHHAVEELEQSQTKSESNVEYLTRYYASHVRIF